MKRHKRKAPARNGRSTPMNGRSSNTQPSESQLTITLHGVAAQYVAQLMHTAIPDLWHMALHPVHKADKEGILLIWYIAHDLKDALQASEQQEGGQP
jgi:hypothetical protein